MNQIPPRLALDVLASESLDAHYSRGQRLTCLAAAAAAGVAIAGFWNFRLVDEFGSQVLAANTNRECRQP